MAKETILCIFSFRKKLTFIRSVFVDINPLRLFSENYANVSWEFPIVSKRKNGFNFVFNIVIKYRFIIVSLVHTSDTATFRRRLCRYVCRLHVHFDTCYNVYIIT